MKRNWRETKFRRPEQTAVEEVIYGKRLTALESLARRYRHFSIIATIMIAWSVIGFFPGVSPFSRNIYLMLAFGIYFLTCSTMDFWLYMGIRSIDIQEMPVSEVVRKALFYRKRHLQFMAILIPMAVALVAFMTWTLTEDPIMLASIAAGALIGLAIGLRQFMRFMSDYRTLTK